jgi:hypothetical protein
MSKTLAHAGSLFVVAAPSGAGKSSLVRELMAQDSALHLSVSFTTRAPRPGELHGREYFFVSEAEFLERQRNHEFLESAKVHGNFYGTSRFVIEENMQAGKDVLLEHGSENLYEPIDLNIACCKLMTAAHKDAPPISGRVRVATKYVTIAEQYFASLGIQAEIIKLYGSMELAPLVGLADFAPQLHCYQMGSAWHGCAHVARQ